MHLFLKLTNLVANNCIKLLLLTSEQNLCEMALVKNAARNGAVCYHHDSKEIIVLLCLFLPKGPTLYWKPRQFERYLARHLAADSWNWALFLLGRNWVPWSTCALFCAPADFTSICRSLLSSCSSFRDSTYADQEHGDDAADLNGIDDIFQGILLYYFRTSGVPRLGALLLTVDRHRMAHHNLQIAHLFLLFEKNIFFKYS